MAIDLALGRGGDQVVVRDNEDVTYYGKTNKQVERNNRVKRESRHMRCGR